VLVGQGCVITLSRLHRAKIARRHPLRQMGRIRATQLNLSLAPHIPQLHMFFKVPVILLDSSFERFGQQSVIDDRVTTDAKRLDTVGIGCAPVAPRNHQTRRHGRGPRVSGTTTPNDYAVQSSSAHGNVATQSTSQDAPQPH